MKRKKGGRSYDLLCLCALLIAIFSPYTTAHDAFYPHHKDDFEEIQRNRNRVALVTAAFITLLTVGIIFGLKKGDMEADEDVRAIQSRLRQHATEAAKSAIFSLKDQPSEALITSLHAYAQVAGVPWQESDKTGDVSLLSCKIGKDFLKAKVFRKDKLVNLEIIATCDEAGAKVVVSETGEIQSSVFLKEGRAYPSP